MKKYLMLFVVMSLVMALGVPAGVGSAAAEPKTVEIVQNANTVNWEWFPGPLATEASGVSSTILLNNGAKGGTLSSTTGTLSSSKLHITHSSSGNNGGAFIKDFDLIRTDNTKRDEATAVGTVLGEIKISSSADIYVSPRNRDVHDFYLTEYYLPWLRPDATGVFEGFAQVMKDDATPMKIQHDGGNVYDLYKKTVEVTDEPVTVSFGGRARTSMYCIFIDWRDYVNDYMVSVKKTGLGTITPVGKEGEAGNGGVTVNKNTTQKFNITPEEGYGIEFVKFNGVIQSELSKTTGTQSFTTPEINKNSILEVKFVELEKMGTVEITKNPSYWEVVQDSPMYGHESIFVQNNATGSPVGARYYNPATGTKNTCHPFIREAVMIRACVEPRGPGWTPETPFASIRIDRPADIYIAPRYAVNEGEGQDINYLPGTEEYLPWLAPDYANKDYGGYTQVMSEGTTPATMQNSYLQNYYLYKKTVNIPKGEQKAEVLLGGLANISSTMYNVFVVWRGTNLYDVTIDANEGGTVKLGDNTSSEEIEGTKVDAEEGSTQSFLITPEAGYAIEYVKFNGQVVKLGSKAEYEEYETPEITDYSNLEVKFCEIDDEAEATIFTPTVHVKDDSNAIYTFAKVEVKGGETVTEYGVEVVTPNLKIKQYKIDDEIEAGATAKIETSGIFGIGLFDPDNKLKAAYSIKHYVVIDGKTIYGDVIDIVKAESDIVSAE